MSEPLLKIAGDTPSPAFAVSGRWLPIKVAAERADRNEGQLRRRILEEGWEAAGLARKAKLPSGQMGWEVNEGADAAFAQVKFVEQKTEEFRSSKEFLALPQTVRDRALQREKMLADWKRKLDAGHELRLPEKIITDRYVAELRLAGIKVSRSQLFAWKADAKGVGLRGLVDEWGKREGPDTSAFWELGQEQWLHPNQKSARQCYDIAEYQAQIHGWQVMSYRDFCRKLRAIPQVVVIKRRFGEKAFVATAEPSIQRDYTSISANDWWVSDHHQLDVMVTHEGKHIRPWLHAWQDVRSRKIIGWTITADSPNAGTILRTFVNAVKEHGRPDNVYVDNGKDFDSRTLQGVTKHQRRRGKSPNDLTPAELARVGGAMNLIGCTITHTWTYHGQSKPIERFFGTLCGRFAKLWESYTGNCPANRPDTLKPALEANHAPTLDELTDAFAEWLHHDYNGRVHTGDGMDGRTPNAVYAATLGTVHRVPDELLEFATFEPVGPVTVNKNGVAWRGLRFGWANEKIIRLLNQKVMLKIDERDSTHVYVIDMQGRLICRADANEKLPWGANKQLISASIGLKKQARKINKEYQRTRTRRAMDVVELAFIANAERKKKQDAAAPKDNAPPPVVRPVQTPFDDQSKAIAEAMQPQLKIAAGAENVSRIPLSQLMASRQEDSHEFD